VQTRSFGDKSWQVPVVGQGSWKLPDGAAAVEGARKALKLGIELGMTHIDTAEMYGEGHSEEIIAGAIAGLPRDRLFIVSKVLPENASYRGTIQACDRSLSRLKLEYLDCYLLHWRGSHPVADTMRAMEELVVQGKIRALGVSNFDVEDLEEAQQALTKEKLACNQVLYHLWERGIEHSLLPYCKRKSISVVGYTPFGQRKLPGQESNEGAALSAVAAKHGATVAQIALAFLVRLDATFTIPKASSEEHVRANAGAGAIKLDDEDIAKIDAAFPAPRGRKPLAWA
jgi:diketogulonate reductase-like aldo/keto reductase